MEHLVVAKRTKQFQAETDSYIESSLKIPAAATPQEKEQVKNEIDAYKAKRNFELEAKTSEWN